MADLKPTAAGRPVPVPQGNSTGVAAIQNRLDTRNSTGGQKLQYLRPAVRGSVVQIDRDFLLLCSPCGLAEIGGREPVVLLKQIIHPAHAPKSRCHRHLQHRQVGVRQQVFRHQKAAGLQILDRRHMILLFKDPAQMPVCAAQPFCLQL